MTSFPLYVIGVLSAILLPIVLYYLHCFTYWKKKGVPYLKPIIPFGTAKEFLLDKVCMGDLYMKHYAEMKSKGWKHGGAFLCGKPIYMPIDNDLVKKIMVSDFRFFPNHGLYLNEESDPMSGHIFNMENYKWKNLRVKMPAAFTAAKMRQMVQVMEKTSAVLIEELGKYADREEPVNIKDILACFATDIISASGFGIDTNTLKNENQTLMKNGREFFDYQWGRFNNLMVIVVPRPILKLIRFKTFTDETNKYFFDMFAKIADHKRKETIKRGDLADMLIELCEESTDIHGFDGKSKIDPLTFEELAAHMYLFFEAGFETSSSAQTFALYEMAVNEEVQRKLREEVNAVLKKHNGKVTYEAVNEMQYLDRLFDETLRKYPILPILPRLCEKDYPVPGTDVVIEKGTFVIVSNLGIHRDPEFYPDPEKFDPDRFTPENKAKRPYCSYMPFGEGPRICLGKRFGIWQSKVGLLSIIRNFNVTLSEKTQTPFKFDTPALILKTKGDVWINLEKII